jgi:hypothetical protein
LVVSKVFCTFADALNKKKLPMAKLRYLVLIMVCLATLSVAGKSKYPGGKRFIYRYYLQDKQGTSFSLERPTRWLSRQSVERRRRQGLALD